MKITYTTQVLEIKQDIWAVYYDEQKKSIHTSKISFLMTETSEEYQNGELIDKYSDTNCASIDYSDGRLDKSNCSNLLGYTDREDTQIDEWKTEIVSYIKHYCSK